ncbi:MAG: hypothetical protein ACTHOG_01890 [Marmoricola sp.]
MTLTATEQARSRISAAADDPRSRLRLLDEIYASEGARGHLPYRRAVASFMGWQISRGLLNPPDHPIPGSAWWRELNAALLRDSYEGRLLALDPWAEPSTRGAAAALAFVREPSAQRWYHAHNLTIVDAYLEHADLARAEDRIERFFINLVLIRVLYAHALVAAPRLSLSWLAPLAPALGDPRLGWTGIFLSLSRVLPDRYPLGDDIERVVSREGGFGHLLDVGVIQPRVRALYEWAADDLDTPELLGFLEGGVPAYAWDPADAAAWTPHPSRWAKAARLGLRPRS